MNAFLVFINWLYWWSQRIWSIKGFFYKNPARRFSKISVVRGKTTHKRLYLLPCCTEFAKLAEFYGKNSSWIFANAATEKYSLLT